MITAYLKPTNYCNVGCSHCYLPEEVRANKHKMDEATLHKVMQFLKEMQIKGKHDQIFLLWHGGEPLILSKDYFEMAGSIVDQYFSSNELIEAVQTSLIPYRPELASIVKNRWRNEIGSSMDFSSRLLNGSAEEYKKLWLSKVDMARKDDIFVIPGITPNKQDTNNANYIFNWFKEHDFWMWNIDRYSNVSGDLPDFSTNREHSKFLIDLFDLCVKEQEKSGYAPMIKAMAAAIGGILYDMPGDRWGGTCQSDFVVINPDGKLNNCPDKDSFEESYGNLFNGFDSFVGSPQRKKWIRIQQAGHRIDDCHQCENSTWCKSGCPITGNACSINGEIDECSGFKSFITHIRKFMNQSNDNKNFLIDYYHGKFIPYFK
jgi:radical SAM protein with 4Fe4S-binding SPASM domain